MAGDADACEDCLAVCRIAFHREECFRFDAGPQDFAALGLGEETFEQIAAQWLGEGTAFGDGQGAEVGGEFAIDDAASSTLSAPLLVARSRSSGLLSPARSWAMVCLPPFAGREWRRRGRGCWAKVGDPVAYEKEAAIIDEMVIE